MAKKKKAEEEVVPQEDMAQVNLDEEEREEGSVNRAEDHLREVTPPEVEEVEQEAVEEEVEEEPEKKDSSNEAILAGFNMLKEALSGRSEPAPVIQKQEGETDEEFNKRVDEELFKENPSKVLERAIDRKARRIIETEVAPVIGSLMETAYANEEFRLRNDSEEGEIYKKYEKEVKDLMRTLTPAQQKNPQVLRAAFDRVKSLHVNEIIDMKVEARERARKPAPAKKTTIGEGGSSVMPSGSTPRQVVLPKKELAALKHRAAVLGIDYRELLARR